MIFLSTAGKQAFFINLLYNRRKLQKLEFL